MGEELETRHLALLCTCLLCCWPPVCPPLPLLICCVAIRVPTHKQYTASAISHSPENLPPPTHTHTRAQSLQAPPQQQQQPTPPAGLAAAAVPVPLPSGATNKLYLDSLPADITKRELAHIFRPFRGYKVREGGGRV